MVPPQKCLGMPSCNAHAWMPSILDPGALFCQTCGRIFRFADEPAHKVAAVKTRLFNLEIKARLRHSDDEGASSP